MPSFKEPSFQDRVASAAKARKKALDQFKAKPPIDEAVMADRRLAGEARERALDSDRAAKAQASAAAKSEKASLAAAAIADAKAAAELKTARLTPASAADMKAARDARYAARKQRK